MKVELSKYEIDFLVQIIKDDRMETENVYGIIASSDILVDGLIEKLEALIKN